MLQNRQHNSVWFDTKFLSDSCGFFSVDWELTGIQVEKGAEKFGRWTTGMWGSRWQWVTKERTWNSSPECSQRSWIWTSCSLTHLLCNQGHHFVFLSLVPTMNHVHIFNLLSRFGKCSLKGIRCIQWKWLVRNTVPSHTGVLIWTISCTFSHFGFL